MGSTACAREEPEFLGCADRGASPEKVPISRRRLAAAIAGPVLLLVFFCVAGLHEVAQSEEINTAVSPRPDDARLNRLDVIFVLGGGVREDGTVPEWVLPRFSRAKELYGRFDGPSARGKPYVVCSGKGTSHVQGNGDRLTEAAVCAMALTKLGLNPKDILEEAVSLDTIGNAVFGRLLHVEPLGLRSCTLVTSDFHMERARAIFEHVFGLQGPSNDKGDIRFSFAATPNEGLPEEALAARREKERLALAAFRRQMVSVEDLQAMHQFITEEHKAYVSERLFDATPPPKMNGNLRSSYGF